MASSSKKRQTFAKMTRERTVREKRELKLEKKRAAAEARRAGITLDDQGVRLDENGIPLDDADTPAAVESDEPTPVTSTD